MPEPFASQKLAGVGVDAEQVRRFEKLAAGDRPWRLVYSAGEAEHLAAQPRAGLAFCAAYCCKEAFCKALGERFPFTECACRFPAGARGPEVVLAPELVERHQIAGVRVRLHERYPGDRGECVVEAHLFRRERSEGEAGPPSQEAPDTAPPVRSRLKSLAVASAASGRALIEKRHFSPAEIAELGERPVQSLAGFLALKSALVALWADAGVATPAAPRDFEISHHPGGAPRIASAPPGPAGVFVSISHTRTWAYGLAALSSAMI
jgi:phosphopantetheinyl transferase (holo-ACP synthase)